MKYHIDKNIPILENIFRPYSDSYFNLLKESRKCFEENKIELNGLDKELFESTDLGLFGIYEGIEVPLDLPLPNEDIIEEEALYHNKEVSLNKPSRSSGPKKYKVYVKNPKTGKIKLIHFGDVN